MRQGFKDSSDAQLYFMIFIGILIALLFVVAYKFLIIKSPDLNTPQGRCEAFCAGIPASKLIGVIEEPGEFLKCLCQNRPPRVDKIYIRRP